jgi:hypothetical protein
VSTVAAAVWREGRQREVIAGRGPVPSHAFNPSLIVEPSANLLVLPVLSNTIKEIIISKLIINKSEYPRIIKGEIKGGNVLE